MQKRVDLDKTTLFHLSMITLLGMPALAFLIINFFHDKGIWETLFKDTVVKQHLWPVGLPIGFVYGFIVVMLGIYLVSRPNMQRINDFFGRLIQKINPSFGHILFYSFCAGVGEEILFRGAIQPLIGIWPTAAIFVLLHGYINFNYYSTTVYGFFLIFVAAGFGYLDMFFGITAPIVAHFLYDVIMFMKLKKMELPPEEKDSEEEKQDDDEVILP